jgi:hypothetical protein
MNYLKNTPYADAAKRMKNVCVLKKDHLLKGLRTLEILFYFISDALRWYEKLYKKKR